MPEPELTHQWIECGQTNAVKILWGFCHLEHGENEWTWGFPWSHSCCCLGCESNHFLLRHHLTAQFGQWPLNSAFWGSASATVLTKVQPYLLSPKLPMNRGTADGHDWRTFVVPIPFYPPELQPCRCLATGDAGRGVESWRWWKLLGYMSPSKSSTSSRWVLDGFARCPSCRIWIVFYHRNFLPDWTTWQWQHGERRATLGWRKPHQQFQSLDLCGAAKAGTPARRQIANLCLWKWWRTMFMQAELT